MKRALKFLSTLTSLIVAALILEGFFVLVYYIQDGGYVPAQNKIQEMTMNTGWRSAESDCESLRAEVSHPYLAFSQLAKPYCPRYDRDSGHTGQVFPRKANPDKFVVLFTGASVPAQLLADAEPTFGQMLSQQYRYEGKEIEVLHGAVVRWKQPQQFIMLMLNAHLIDAVVSMEGFNELVSGFGNQYRYDFASPILPSFKGSNINFISKELLLLSWLYKRAFESIQNGYVLKHLKTTVFVVRAYRHWMQGYSDLDSERVGAYRQQINPFLLPKSWSYDERKDHYVDMYHHYIRNMQALAQANQLKFALFIQPVPLIGKTLTAEEKEALKKYKDYGENYTQIHNSLLELRDEGINIFTLKNVFLDYKETVYHDGIHLELEGQAPQLLNQAIIDILAEQWGLDRKSGGN
jgi:hypothetical protein